MNHITLFMIDCRSSLMPQVYQLRHQVFVVEQGVPVEMEKDEYDELADHFVVVLGTEVVGTMRLVTQEDSAWIGRVAVREDLRGQGIGKQLLLRALTYAIEKGLTQAVLNSEVVVKGFYQKLGFHELGDVFEDAGMPHIRMRKFLRGDTAQ